MILKIIFILSANILFLYFFWKRLKEDYLADHVFTTAVYVIFAGIISQVVSKRFFSQWWFWIGFVAILTGLAGGIYRYKLRIIESVEALFLSALPVLILIFTYHFITTRDHIYLLASIFLLLLIFTFYIFDKHYKGFSWYKSGRIGFSGLTIAGIFFLTRSAVASFLPDMLSFSGKYEVYISAMVAFIAFLGVFTLARKRT
jgi:hypothetical protein